MKKRFTKKFEDNSIESGYAFTFFCDICGKPYHTQFIDRMKMGSHDYHRAHRLALAQAAREAKLHFNRCANCHKWVCDRDFDIDTGLCSDCAKKF